MQVACSFCKSYIVLFSEKNSVKTCIYLELSKYRDVRFFYFFSKFLN